MNEIIEALKKAWEWFISTDLPKHTAEAFANIIQHAGGKISELMNEYIYVIFK